MWVTKDQASASVGRRLTRSAAIRNVREIYIRLGHQFGRWKLLSLVS